MMRPSHPILFLIVALAACSESAAILLEFLRKVKLVPG